MGNQNQEKQNNLDEVPNESAFQPLTDGEQAQVTGGHWNEVNMEKITVDANIVEKPHNCPPGHIWQSELNTCIPHEPYDPNTHGIFNGAVIK